jgi:uncharacterized protein YcaQ
VRISAREARHALLAAQGFAEDPLAPFATRSLLELIERVGYVQVDSINVVERAHHLTLFARNHQYRREQLAQLHERDRSLFEHWTHDASLIPVSFFAHWHHRRKRLVERKQDRLHAWMRERLGPKPRQVIGAVLRRIEREGPLQSRDFEHAPGKTGPWWGWKPAKAALEYLWWRGDLSISRRINFQKVYDLTARVYPLVHCLPPPTEKEFVDWCCREALARIGPATAREIAGFFGAVAVTESRAWCERAIRRGEVVPALIESSNVLKPVTGVALPDWRERSAGGAAASNVVRLLAPFDPIVRDRERARRLFSFDYTFEAFVPAPKRKFGYYVLPILRDDRLIGRTDLKNDRARRALVVQGFWLERDVRSTKKLRGEIDDALGRLANFIGARTVEFTAGAKAGLAGGVA